MTTEQTPTTDPKNTDPQAREIKVERFERSLPVKLTDAQRIERGDRIAHLVSVIAEKEDARKASNSAAKSQIEEVQAELNKISGELRSGSVHSTVACRREFRYRTNSMVELREDTGATLHERPLTEAERQLELKANGKSVKGDKTEPANASGKGGGGKSKKNGKGDAAKADAPNGEARDTEPPGADDGIADDDYAKGAKGNERE